MSPDTSPDDGTPWPAPDTGRHLGGATTAWTPGDRPPSGPRSFAPRRAARLSWLLEIAGPAGRADLLDQMSCDLAAAREDLRVGLQHDDAERLGRACHVLVALAGTLGDGALTARVQALQRRLRDQRSPAAARASHPGLIEALDALRAEVTRAAANEERRPGP